MYVREICSRDVKACSPETDLARLASIMWENDCGVVPVVNPQNRVVGIVTDRDICMAVATKGRLASEIRADEVMAREIRTCQFDDDVRNALKGMASQKVRRLPVVDQNNQLQGILSINDCVLATEETPGLDQEVIKTFRAICEHYAAKVPVGAGKRR